MSPSPPSWEVLLLVARHLGPKSLAKASCVSKSWYMSMASDQLWQPICIHHYPSLSNLKTTHPFVPYHRLYAVAYSASKRRTRGPPTPPHISLDNLIFDIHILGTDKSRPIIKMAKLGNEFRKYYDHNGVFRFEFGYMYEYCSSVPVLSSGMVEDIRITWNVVLRDWSAAFTMMDCEGKVRFAPGAEGWFSQELPQPVCCTSTGASSGVEADLKLVFCGGKREGGGGETVVRVDKVSVGILNVANWRYVTIDDGIRYLQHFLVHC